MLVEVHTFFSHRKVVVNMDQIVKIVPFNEEKGSTLYFTDRSKLPVDEELSYFIDHNNGNYLWHTVCN